MAKIVTVDELLDAASESGLASAEDYVARFEALTQELAEALACHLDASGQVLAGPARWELGTLAVPVRPRRAGVPCPGVIDAADPEGEWEPIGG